MGLPALKEQFELGVQKLAKRDWETEFGQADTVEAYAIVIDQGVMEFAAWRRDIAVQLNEALTSTLMESKNAGPAEALQAIDGVIVTVESCIVSLRAGVDEFGAVDTSDFLLSTQKRRYLNKQIKRGRQVGIDLYNFYVDAYYALLATRSELEEPDDEEAPGFTSGAALEQYLRSELG